MYIPGARSGGVFSLVIVERRPGILVFRPDGPKAEALFQDEAGGHRWQRIPPTEKRGRVQTSTITVAVMGEDEVAGPQIREQDLIWRTCRGTGPGGQHRNKTESAVQLTHLPTGLSVRCDASRSQPQNRATALRMLQERLGDRERAAAGAEARAARRQQVGSGMRGDKRRTIRVQDGQVNDHVTGQRWDLKSYLRGDW